MTREEIESGLKKYEIIAALISDDLEAMQKHRLRKEKGGGQHNEQVHKQS